VTAADSRFVNAPGVRWAAVYVFLVTFIWYQALSYPRPENSLPFFATIGLIASWRYSWWLTHQIRGWIFLHRVFPRLRRDADAAPGRIKKVYAVVLSYNIPEDAFVKCYSSLMREAVQSGVPTTIIASITTDRDRRLLEQCYWNEDCRDGVEILAQFQKGDGKRSAIAEGLRAIARDLPPENSVTILLDGDIVLGDHAIERVLPFFAADPKLAAATTNNSAIVDGDYVARSWYALRMAQRHTLMASMALSRRLLVLTGRYSLFRTDIATSADFINQVEADKIIHWRLGEITFLTGDDKSTWFNVLKRGERMLYVPDVIASGIEEPPAPGAFFRSASRLMVRWFGNMLRANGRAIALGPRQTGLFVWWCLVDQRISIWTSLAGPVATVLLAVFLSPTFILYYFAWALATRTTMSLAAALNYGRFSPTWPFLMYFNQVGGAMMKVWLLFNLDRQNWTRQVIGARRNRNVLVRSTGSVMLVAAICAFTALIGLITGQLAAPSPGARHDAWRFVASAFEWMRIFS